MLISFLHKSLHLFVAIGSNFKLHLIIFSTHKPPWSRLSQWLKVLSQKLHQCTE